MLFVRSITLTILQQNITKYRENIVIFFLHKKCYLRKYFRVRNREFNNTLSFHTFNRSDKNIKHKNF